MNLFKGDFIAGGLGAYIQEVTDKYDKGEYKGEYKGKIKAKDVFPNDKKLIKGIKELLDGMYEMSDWKLSWISRQDNSYKNHINGTKMNNEEIINEYYHINSD